MLHYRDLDQGRLPVGGPRLLALLLRRRYAGRVWLLALTAVGGIGLISLEPLLLRRLIELLARGDAAGWTAEIATPLLLVGAAWLGSAGFNRLREWAELHTTPALRADMQSLLFTYVLDHAPEFFQGHLAGQVGQKIRQAGEAAALLLGLVSNEIVRLLAAIVIGFALTASQSLLFPTLFLGWTLLTLALSALLARRCMRLSHDYSDAVSTAAGRIVDTVSNAEIVRAFARGPAECLRVATALGDEMDAAKRLRRHVLTFALLLYTGLVLFQFAFTALAVHMAVMGRMGLGEVVMIFSLGAILATNVWALCARMQELFEQAGVLGSALDIVLQPHAIHDPAGAPALVAGRGELRFERVGFSHRNGTTVFRDFDLHIQPGEKVGLVGPSGAGKSTLLRLLTRQFEPQQGRILIDGQDIAAVSLASLAGAISEVPQDPGLFHRSIADNIRYARPDAPDDELVEAARRAHCHDFIQRRPGGYDAIVGERGVRLSGGERQRIAVARAFLKPTRLLLLDEATSALDSETEHHIRQALWELIEGRTVIAIAHRLGTVSRMDRILYLEAGRVVEEGGHDELLARGGRYAQLWARQVHGYIG